REPDQPRAEGGDDRGEDREHAQEQRRAHAEDPEQDAVDGALERADDEDALQRAPAHHQELFHQRALVVVRKGRPADQPLDDARAVEIEIEHDEEHQRDVDQAGGGHQRPVRALADHPLQRLPPGLAGVGGQLLGREREVVEELGEPVLQPSDDLGGGGRQGTVVDALEEDEGLLVGHHHHGRDRQHHHEDQQEQHGDGGQRGLFQLAEEEEVVAV